MTRAYRAYTDEQFIDAVKHSISVSQILKTLGLSSSGTNFKLAKKRIKELELDDSHFTGQSYLKGKTHNWARSIPLKDILVKDSSYHRGHLKARLIKEGIFENKCYKCGLTEWRGKPLTIQIEHKNGVNNDNREENLTFLCPNCHSQTPTYCGRNKKQSPKKYYYCTKCDKKISRTSKSGLCIKCVKKTVSYENPYRKVQNRPSKEQLSRMVKEASYCAVGREYGVSDTCIKKWIKRAPVDQ